MIETTPPGRWRRRVAIVLLNLGGPDSPAAVRPFLTNLFCDPAILRVPDWLRRPLGRFIAWRRTAAAQANYALMGGSSPLLRLTEEQATALDSALAAPELGFDARSFVAMRYWHPFAAETVQQVKAWQPDEVLLLPLYPQFSTTTTGSSFQDWQEAAAEAGLSVPTQMLCCWHSDAGYIAASAAILRQALEDAAASLPEGQKLRLLFSAHGLPESIVAAGDPYEWQVNRSAASLVAALNIPGLDHTVCFQSRVTPQKWLSPSVEEELKRAAADKTAVLVMPIAFVSDHSETLVELDIEYRELAHKLGVPGYFRAPSQNSDPAFIAAMATLVCRTLATSRPLCSFAGARQCPKPHSGCPHTLAGAPVGVVQGTAA